MTDIFIAAFGVACLIGTLISRPDANAAISQEGLTDIEISAKALEIYLQDKEDHKKHCPKVKWDQPALDTYKKKLKSQLPEGCKK
tara:strand:+ start:134 stop:388 length:255 start_codon:yes stop_codon:yes gene_type:complete